MTLEYSIKSLRRRGKRPNWESVTLINLLRYKAWTQHGLKKQMSQILLQHSMHYDVTNPQVHSSLQTVRPRRYSQNLNVSVLCPL